MDTWSESDTGLALAFVRERLNADFDGTGLPEIEFRIDPAWSGTPPESRDREDVVLVCGGHEFPVGLQGGVEQACGYAAYQLQDDVIAEGGRAWPEVVDARGEFVGVLAPPIEPAAVAVWELAGRPFCAVGHLHQAIEAAALRIR
ncbi:MAG TPA: hypothetical protein VFI00_21645 [Kribbella sp.]|nr:hypothetical protein [Kribbella sp.]